MSKKLLRKIIALSYTKESLDEEKVLFIASKLRRKELKEYIKALKLSEIKNKVLIESPFELSSLEKNKFSHIFKNKSLEFAIDPSIITGVRVNEGDVSFENSLSKTLEEIVNSVSHYE